MNEKTRKHYESLWDHHDALMRECAECGNKEGEFYHKGLRDAYLLVINTHCG